MAAIGIRTGPFVAEYLGAIAQFSRNARLYLVHVAGMDMIHGTWEVLFNLYLLALFSPTGGVDLFGRHLSPIEFVGLRLAVGAVASGIGSLPAGLLSDRIGRKASFILGDGGGAILALLNVVVTNPVVLVCTPLLSSVLGSLHYVAETAFMAENSEARERMHLFGVARALSTAVAMVGSLIAATHPAVVTWFGDALLAYRTLTVLGIAVWLASLVPALLLRERRGEAAGASEDGPRRRVSIGLGSIRHPVVVAKLVATGALVSVGYAAAMPFLGVFYHEHLHADEHEIGFTFAGVSAVVALGALLAPVVGARLGKVQGVVASRLLSVPFVLALAFWPEQGDAQTVGLSLVGMLVAARALFGTLSLPLYDAFSMEVLDPGERATTVGLEAAAGSVLQAAATLVGSGRMAVGDYQAPFLIAAVCYLASTGLFWLFFRQSEARRAPRLEVARSAEPL